MIFDFIDGMKKIVRGNDLTLRIPVRKMVDGKAVRFALPACTDLEVSVVNAYRRTALEFVVEAEDDSMIDARLKTSAMGLGCYALEVKGKLFGNWWRSNEYEQFRLVDNNASADTAFDGEVIEGEDSVEMDTAIVFMPPTAEMEALLKEAEGAMNRIDTAVEKAENAAGEIDAAVKKTENIDIDLANGEADKSLLRITRPDGGKKDFELMQLKGDKGDKGDRGEKGEQGDKLTYGDLTAEEIAALQKPATEAAARADAAAEEIGGYRQQTDAKVAELEKTVKEVALTGGASTAHAVSYDNSGSGLSAISVQGAIDELAAKPKLEQMTQADYEALEEKDDNTYYMCTEG